MVARAILERICDELWGMTLSWHFLHGHSRLCALALAWVSAMVVSAQPSTFPPLPVDDARIQGVTFHPVGQPIAPPVVSLEQSQERGVLELRFDDMTGDYTPWEVQIVHCDRRWQPSDLHPSEYLQGFYSTPTADDEASFGTKVDFTHHLLRLPNDDVRWTRSGNYLLQIVDPYDPERPLVQRRFVVFEELCDVDAKVGEPSDLALVRSHQEVHFTLKERNYSLSDPYDRLTVTVVPNWTWSRAITGREPRFVKGAEIDFTRSGHVFEGGNTHRFVDLKGLEFSARGVARLEEHPDAWHFWLETDERRTYDYFSGGQDIHGASVTHNDRLDPYTGSDHVWVHWSLDTRHPLAGRDIYVVGALSQHQCRSDFKMTYNADRGLYTLDQTLKQGYHNYHYVVRERGERDSAGQLLDVEGSHAQTNNLYTLVVHYEDWEGYDRVVGLSQWESHP